MAARGTATENAGRISQDVRQACCWASRGHSLTIELHRRPLVLLLLLAAPEVAPAQQRVCCGPGPTQFRGIAFGSHWLSELALSHTSLPPWDDGRLERRRSLGARGCHPRMGGW